MLLTIYERELYTAKVVQNFLWSNPLKKYKHRVRTSVMSEQEWNREDLKPYIKKEK